MSTENTNRTAKWPKWSWLLFSGDRNWSRPLGFAHFSDSSFGVPCGSGDHKWNRCQVLRFLPTNEYLHKPSKFCGLFYGVSRMESVRKKVRFLPIGFHKWFPFRQPQCWCNIYSPNKKYLREQKSKAHTQRDEVRRERPVPRLYTLH